MEKKLNIDGYLQMIDSKFSGFDGLNEIQLGADGAMADARMMSPQVQARRTQPTPYSVSVVNSTAGTLTAVLFGYNQYQATANYGSAVGLVVTPSQANVSYIMLLSQSASQPFETSKIRVNSTNAAQVIQPLSIQSTDANGNTCTEQVITQMYFSPDQFQSGIVDVPVNKVIDGNTNISFGVFATTTVVLTFFPLEKVNTARVLGGTNQSPLKLYTAAPERIVTAQLATRV